MFGPYPVLSLRFPALRTPAKLLEKYKQTGERGCALNFVVDTAANVNTIKAQLAEEIGAATVGFDAGGISAGFGALVRDNVSYLNGGLGLTGSVAYHGNVFRLNNGGDASAQVDAGLAEIGVNQSDTDTVCP